MDDVVHDIHEDKVHSFEDAEQPRRLVQASGAIRGVIIGLARALTRPSQMKVFVFLAKKKWKQRAGAAEKESWSKLLGPPVLVEGAIGAFMYDVFAKTTGHIERSGGVPYTGAYQAYFNTFAAGTVAGCTSAVLNTPYNNLVRLHGGYATPATVWRGLQSGELALSGKRSLFSGVGHACYRDSFSVACMFTSNLWFKKNLPQPPCDSLAWGTFHAFMAGGLGGAVGTMSAIPFIRVREVSTQYVEKEQRYSRKKNNIDMISNFFGAHQLPSTPPPSQVCRHPLFEGCPQTDKRKERYRWVWSAVRGTSSGGLGCVPSECDGYVVKLCIEH